MLSVIIPTLDSERELLPTLAALVPGALEGLISEVIVADGGSRDETAKVADAAGCNILLVTGPAGGRLRAAASAARAPFLLFLRPGIVPDASWIGAARRFVEQPSSAARAAIFRRGAPAQPTLRDVLSLLMSTLGARPSGDQGLLIAHQFYDALGGHRDRTADPEAELVRRLGRRRIVTLACSAAAEILD
jgi:glycosyltransferase involved in cell wall biosynthesis